MIRVASILAMVSIVTAMASKQSQHADVNNPPHHSTKVQIEERIDEFIENVMECMNIPGLTLALVKDRQVLYLDNRLRPTHQTTKIIYFNSIDLKRAFGHFCQDYNESYEP
jgi:CubicO group peptidase (beta-lactamase class C family)